MSISADGSASTIAMAVESVWGITPTTPTFRKIRSTGNSLAGTLSKTQSEELTEQAAVTDVIPTQGGAEGDVNFEPSYGYFMDTFLAHTLRGVFDAFGVLKAGSLEQSLTLERNIPANGIPLYFRYPGTVAGTLAITLDAEATSPIAGTLTVMGKNEIPTETIVAGATYVDANTNPVMSMPELRAIDVEIEGVSKTACFKNLSFTINNNLRLQQGKCTDVSTYPDIRAKGVGYGRREVSLDIVYYFNDLDYAQMFQENTDGVFSYILTDGTRGYKITFPRAKIQESTIPIEGNNSDVVQNMTVMALLDSTEGTDVIVEKIGNLAASAGIQLTGTTPDPDFQGTFYYDGDTQNDGENVYISVDGLNAIWYSTSDLGWTVTAVADIGTFPTVEGWEIPGISPVGSWQTIGTATGDLTGTDYDPQA